MRKLLIISGPTASGKTSLASSLVKKFNGELVSADSRQIYRGMDIITGKEIDKNIKTWMVDVADPDEEFSVLRYYDLAWEAIEDIWKRGKLPILVGGTGFYIKAVLDRIDTMGIAPDWALRRKLEKLTVGQLQERLKKLNPKRWEEMNKSDRLNLRRLIRAIEIAQRKQETDSGQARMTSFWEGAEATTPESSILWIGLTAPNAVLYKRIDERVDERVKMGAVKETKQLAKKFGWEIPSMTGQGYRELRGFIEKKISLEEAVKRWKFAEHEYARKQMTWFKKEKRIVWVDITEPQFDEKVEKKIAQWYTSN